MSSTLAVADQARLISTIKAHLARGDKATGKAEQHYVAAGCYLNQLKSTTGSWAEWEDRLTTIGISTGRASELMQIADGRKTADQLTIANTTRSRRRRSSWRNEEARLERAIEVVAAVLADEDKREDLLHRLLKPLHMVAIPKCDDGTCDYVEDDGGRSESGVLHAAKRGVGDCVARAIAIATQKPYREVHDALVARSVHHPATDTSDYGKHLRRGRRISFRVIDADHGCHRAAYGPYLESLGWQCTIPDRRVRLRADEL